MARLHVGMLVALGLALAGPLRAGADALDLAPARDCLERNTPKTTVSFRAEFTKVDRVGGERHSRATVSGKKLDDGLHRIVVRFDRPPEMRGTAMLMIESATGPSDFYVWSPDERRVRRVQGRSNSGLFGTDFSYDDFENWRTFQKHGHAERLPDASVAERPVYVIQSAPAAGEESSYERVVTSVDRETCVVLKIESYEPGGRLRKVLSADPAKVQRVGDLAIAGAIELEDVVDQTHTRVVFDQVQLDAPMSDSRFRPTDLSSGE
ncbi:MAG: outer membrane lipoprotein-sorting protein [Myxococcota bacterium]